MRVSFILRVNNLLVFFFALIFSGKLVLANQNVFENYDSFRNSEEYLSEFVITDERNVKWKNFFSNKSFKEIELFLQTMPINTSDKLIQEIIFEILVSKKTFDRNLINSKDDKILFESLINKLFDTGRLNEIELVYSQTSELESNSFILKKMIEGNLLRNRHSEACKILQKVNQDIIFSSNRSSRTTPGRRLSTKITDEIGPTSLKLRKILTDIQLQKIEDPFGWIYPIEIN